MSKTLNVENVLQAPQNIVDGNVIFQRAKSHDEITFNIPEHADFQDVDIVKEPISNLNEIQDILCKVNEENKNLEIDKKHDCEDKCICKMKQAVSLIVTKIREVDTAIKHMESKVQCPYVPTPDDKREFSKSVQKHSSVCHTIIQELKNQRIEIDEMLQLYQVSTRDFLRLESTLNREREKIQRIETVLVSVEDIVKNVKTDMDKRHENFLIKMESVDAETETREEILKKFIEWVESLETKHFEENEQFDLLIEEASLERNKDRMMLTLAVKQLQEVRKIELLISMQQTSTTQEPKEGFNETIDGPKVPWMIPRLCRCALPINKAAITANSLTRNCALKVVGPVTNMAALRCTGGADVYPRPFWMQPVVHSRQPRIKKRQLSLGGRKA